MKYQILLSLLFLFTLLSTQYTAAGTIVEYKATIEYANELVDPNTLPKSKIISFNENYLMVRNSRIVFNMLDLKTGSYYAAAHFWGQKKAFVRTIPEVKSFIKIDSVTKYIAGIACKKMLAITEADTIEVYYTDIFGINFCPVAKIKGFAMEYSMPTDIYGKVTYTAVKFQMAELPNSIFDISDYTIQDGASSKAQKNKERLSENMVGNPLKKFNIKLITGEKINSDNLKGKIIVLNFWYTACRPCAMEIPYLNKLVEKYKDNNDIVFIAIANDQKSNLKKFLEKIPFNYRMAYLGSFIAARYKVKNFPTNIIIDQEGNISKYIIGYNPSVAAELSNEIEALL